MDPARETHYAPRPREAGLETLGDRIQRSGKLDEKDVGELAARVAGWLEHRHREGDVHGSLNPAAIVLPTGAVRMAALYHPSEVDDVPSYFSPERLERGQTSKADDVWALGCIMYFGLTGHPPFVGANPREVLARVQQGAAAPLAVFDVCDDDLADIVESMISLTLAQRVTSASTLREQLSDWLLRKKVKVGPMLEVLHQGPTVRVSLADMARLPLKAKRPEPPLVDRLPSTAELLARARTSTKKSTVPPPLPAPGQGASQPPEARPKSLPPPLPLPAVHESRPPEARPKSLPPPFPIASPSGAPAPFGRGEDRIPKAPALPVLPIDVPPPMPTPPPIGVVRVVEPKLEPPDVPAPAPPISTRPLANLFDGLDEIEPPAPAAAAAGAPTSMAPLAPSVAPLAPSIAPLAAAPPSTSIAPIAELAPPKKSFPVAIVIGAIAALVVVGYVVVRFTGGSDAPADAAEKPSANASATLSVATTSPSTTSPSVPTSSALASPSSASSTPAVAVGDPEQCMESLLAPGSIAEGAKPDFTFMCTEVDPRKVASKIRSTVIRSARGAVSDAMREWAVLGWYEYAAFAAMRGRCCPQPEKIVLPSTSGLCPPMDDALNQISSAAHPGATDAEQDAALKGYRSSLLCIARGGSHGVFGPYDPPSGGQDTAFMKTFARTRN